MQYLELWVCDKMIRAEELVDGSAISQILLDLGTAIIDVFLVILVAAFQMGWDWFLSILDLTFLGDNPAVFLIGVILIITAFLIWRK